MSNSLNRMKLSEGVHFSTIADSRFKTNRISVHFLLPLTRETVTTNALLPFLLTKGYQGCPDFTQLSRKLSQLYSASLTGNVKKMGDSQVITLTASSIDNRYALEGEDVTTEICEILLRSIFEPVTENGVFRASEVDLERQSLIDAIESELNEKRRYAISRAQAVMCDKEPYGIPKNGYVSDAKEITPQSAFDAYRNMLRTAQVEIICTGGGDFSEAREAFAKAFSSMDRAAVAIARPDVNVQVEALKDVEEQMAVTQSKLVLGFRVTDPDLAAVRMMVSVLGGSPSSLLFMNVREKLSLCYYCAASYDRHKGILLIDSGVEKDNISLARTEILKQLETIHEDAFTDEEMESARLSLMDAFRTVSDDAASLEAFYLGQIYSGRTYTPEEEAGLLTQVSRKEIVRAAQSAALDTVYLLTSKQA